MTPCRRPRGAAYWPGWDIARGLALLPDGTGGVVLDGYGGLHPFGIAGHAAPTVSGSAYWPGFDIARGIAIQPDGTSGYVIDGYGARHAISVNGSATPGVWGYGQIGPDWPGFAIARGISIAFELHAESGAAVLGGYVSDAFGRIYPVGQEGPLGTKGSPTFGTAPAVGAPFWPTWAIARGIGAYPNGYGGYELDGFGGLHPFVFAGQP
jgi:hypothetical protein